jgi:hypothetical protein
MLLAIVLSFVVLLTLVEKAIMPPRSRSLTCHIYNLFLHWEYAKTCVHPLKYSTPTLGVDKKISKINTPCSTK